MTELTKLSGAYFEKDTSLEVMFATSDGNFFYQETYATEHSRKKGIEKIKITREDWEKSKNIPKINKNGINNK